MVRYRNEEDGKAVLESAGVVLPTPPEIDYSHLVSEPKGPFGKYLLKKNNHIDLAMRAALDALDRRGHTVKELSIDTLDYEMCSHDQCRIALEIISVVENIAGICHYESTAGPWALATAADNAALVGCLHAQLVAVEKDPLVLEGIVSAIRGLNTAAVAVTAAPRRANVAWGRLGSACLRHLPWLSPRLPQRPEESG
jgi:hypothetical protein